MARLREWLVRLGGILIPGRTDRDLEEELRLHLELAAEHESRHAELDADARRAAAIRAGGIAQAMDALRDQRGLPWLDDLRQDARYAVRTLRKSPGFATVAIVTLALGIGATTAIYSVVDAILLRPLPFRDSDRLVHLVENVTLRSGRTTIRRGVTYQEFLEWRARTRTLSDMFVAGPIGLRTVRMRAGTARLWGAMMSADAFALLGVRPLLGRTLVPGDETSPNVVVIGYDAWRRDFHSDPGVIGTTIELQPPETMFRGDFVENRVYTVVGVLPAEFAFPNSTLDFHVPAVLVGTPSFTGWAFGRLRPGVPMKDAIDEANVIGSAIRPLRPGAPPLPVPRFDVRIEKEQVVRELRPALRVLLAAVAVVLLIVCANMANLMLARGAARERETAVRIALGAGRGRVVRQVLTESMVLAVAGGVAGALVAAAGVTLVKELAAVEAPGIFRVVLWSEILPRRGELGVDPRVFAIAFTIAAITSVVFGALPAQYLSRADRLPSMGSRTSGPGRSESRIRAALVAGQIVMATVLLVSAGLLAHSFLKLMSVEKGYDPANVLTFQLAFPGEYSIARKTATIEAVLARLRAMPKVQVAGFTRAGILIPEEIFVGTFVPEGRTLDEMRADPMKPRLRPVSHGYLTAVGVRLLDGRELEARDGPYSAPVVVISRAVARHFFAAKSAVGQVLNWYVDSGAGAVPVQVVGVVEDVRNESPDREPNPDVFVDYRQLLPLLQQRRDSPQRQDELALGFVSFAIRTRDDPAATAPAVDQIVRSIDPNAVVDAMIPMDRLVASSIARPRFYAVMLGLFAGVAAVLAVIGIYGVLAYAVIQRTQEIGVRMALGAQRAQVLALVLRQGAVVTTAGIGLGLLGAAAATRLLQGLLFGITPLDPTIFLAVAVTFGLVATLASYVPARRATKVDPMVVLRHDG